MEAIIETENIIFTRPQLSCAGRMVELMNDPRIYNFISNEHTDLTLEDEIDWVNRHQDDNVFSMFTCDGQYIGNCGFNEIENNIGTIGIFISPEFQNQGLGTEALMALIDYGFNILQLQEINLVVFSHNERAIRCYSKLGFIVYDRVCNVCERNNVPVDDIYMRLKR